ncbi:MAG TPA: SAM-dependent methyltransferase, partial [Ramlibacter sp.]|nr:SAM-dependent methyltransferase [Ramlibacter sp.]
YLLPSLNEKLRPILLNMKPGTRVTSHEFGMGDWQPDRTDDVSGRRAHLWIVPARVAGTWTVRSGSEPPLQVQLDQQFQRLQGHAMVGGQQVPLQAAAVRGTAVTFAVPQGGGVLRFEGTARDHNGPLQGDVVLPGGARRPFTATRA